MFERKMEISNELLTDAEVALQTSDQDEINLCIENLSDSISSLERNLSNTLQIYQNDAKASTDTIFFGERYKREG